MERQELLALTDEELLVEKKKLKNAKIFHAALIGFIVGILVYGLVSWSMSSERSMGFFIAMFLPVFMVYKMIQNGKKNKVLEDVLKERGLA